MYKYNYYTCSCFLSEVEYTSKEVLQAGACISPEVVKRINTVMLILEEAKLLMPNSAWFFDNKLAFSNEYKTAKSLDRQKIYAELETLTKSNSKGIFGLRIFGSGILYDHYGRENIVELVVLHVYLSSGAFDVYFDTRDWLPAYIEEEGEEYDEYTDHHIVPERYEPNKGRLEAAYVAIEAATGLKQDIQDYFDIEYDWGYGSEGRSFYTPRRIWEIMREEFPWFDDMDIMPYLAPSEAQKYLAEQISPKIEKLRELASQRPLLAREQLELDILQKILQSENLTDIDLIIDNLKQTPTDTQLRQRLLEKAAVKRNILLEKQSAFR
jgi:hypothetical protein